ncbi:MAG: ABC transporter ATP-binding protein/permease, partial [Lachnospiraceae bacterium]|nr:ABC transporter ATP-binding protein/permease [Lachnospiraceae bacterium]
MLELKQIKKDYPAGDGIVHALKGVDIKFRRSEFVSILGPSGCGKTTLLNIIGGLDQYTDGDLIINGRSTKDYKDRDWDTYRNNSIGFVFQSYNLIPHQTVLQNVELALTLSGVSKKERKERAKEALEKVGLGNQLNKRPAQMSGGQMQRVAIARALVNNPDIILADEPTGALDTETSVQVMDILKEISKDRLIIMVTHNPELAEQYSSRIIRILDGELKGDSNPMTAEQVKAEAELDKKEIAERGGKRIKKPSMSVMTSFGLSLRNLFTKKGRTILTAFAGSIGIIGVALILSISTGLNSYIENVEEETLTSYPIQLESQTMSLSTILTAFMGTGENSKEHDKNAVYQNASLYNIMNALGNLEVTENDLKSFKEYMETEIAACEDGDGGIKDSLTGVHYTYNLDMQIYTKNVDGDIVHSDLQKIMRELMMKSMGISQSALSSLFADSGASSSMMQMNNTSSRKVFEEMLPGLDGEPVNKVIKKQYDCIYGRWPEAYDEMVIILNENNEIDDITLYALGLVPYDQVQAITDAAVNHTTIENPDKSWSYEEICAQEYKLLLNADCYSYDSEEGKYDDLRDTDAGLQYLYDNGVTLKVVGIIRPNEDATTTMLRGAVGYTSMLVDYVVASNKESDIIKKQIENPDVDVFNGLVFENVANDYSDEQKAKEVKAYFDGLTDEEKAAMYVQFMSTISEDELEKMVEQQMAGMDRKTIEASLIPQYAAQMNISEEQIKEYLAQMSDDDLMAIVREGLKAQIAEQYASAVIEQLAQVPEEQLVIGFDQMIDSFSTEDMAGRYNDVIETSKSKYENNLIILGNVDLDDPDTINLYASSFENKDKIEDFIAVYNADKDELEQIEYTDYIGLLMSSITTILNAITYVLIAFVAISLVVSSIMIGVITLISVQERTKEIGILRAIGASKKDVSGLFNAETIIIGFTSGIIGIVITIILCFPINAIIFKLTEISGLKAYLPPVAAVVLVIISVLLTLISGVIPSRSAAKKDPVV